jgi:hypothetical protein
MPLVARSCVRVIVPGGFRRGRAQAPSAAGLVQGSRRHYQEKFGRSTVGNEFGVTLPLAHGGKGKGCPKIDED